MSDEQVLLALLLAALAGIVAMFRGGSLQRVAETRFSWVWLLFAGFGLQLGFQIWNPEWLTDGWKLTITLLSISGVLAFLVLNRNLAGTLIAALGLTLNVAVISLNGAMPVSLEAVERAGLDPAELSEPGIKHEILDRNTVAPFLGDVLALPLLNQILSVGDIFLAVGFARVVYVRAMSRGDAGLGR